MTFIAHLSKNEEMKNEGVEGGREGGMEEGRGGMDRGMEEGRGGTKRGMKGWRE